MQLGDHARVLLRPQVDDLTGPVIPLVLQQVLEQAPPLPLPRARADHNGVRADHLPAAPPSPVPHAAEPNQAATGRKRDEQPRERQARRSRRAPGSFLATPGQPVSQPGLARFCLAGTSLVLSKDGEIRAAHICLSASVASMQRAVVTTTPESVPAR